MRNIKGIIGISGGVFVLSCIGLAAAVISDLEWLAFLCIVAGIAALVVLPVGIIAAFLKRKFVAGLVGIGVLALNLAVAFFTMILIGVGQHHPPKHTGEEFDLPDTCIVMEVEEEEP